MARSRRWVLRGMAVVLAELMLAGVATPVTSTPAAATQLTVQASSEVDGYVTRAEVLARARKWIDERVPYSQSDTWPDPQGRRYRQDCSGYVSMAWHLGTSRTVHTSDPSLYDDDTVAIAKSDLRPGDAVFIEHGDGGGPDHVALFVRWANTSRTVAVTWEERTWGEVAQQLNRTWGSGYQARRYKKIVEDSGTVALPGASAYGSGSEHHAYGRGADGSLVHWWYQSPSEGWRQAAIAGGVAGQPSSYTAGGEHHVYARGSDSYLWHWWWTSTSDGWQRQKLGGPVTGDPVAYSNRPGEHHVYVRGEDGTLRHWFWTASSAAWRAETMNGVIAGKPTGYARDGEHHVYARGADNALWHWWYIPGGWQRQNLGGAITDDPAGYSPAPGEHHVYTRAVSGALWHWWYTADTNRWIDTSMGGAITGSPAAYGRAGEHHVYARAISGVLWHWWYTPYSDGWDDVNLGGAITASPTAYAPTTTEHHVYARAVSGAPWHWWYTPYTDDWRNGTMGGVLSP